MSAKYYKNLTPEEVEQMDAPELEKYWSFIKSDNFTDKLRSSKETSEILAGQILGTPNTEIIEELKRKNEKNK